MSQGPRAILVDGPRRGELADLDDAHQSAIVFALPQPITFVPGEPIPETTPSAFNQVVYQITRLKMFGEFLVVGSVRTRPDDRDLFEALASNAAKDAALR